ncbi:hypothetical protein AMTR_s00148p00067250 [Amborella trichopoda]|uniref:Uncharacterized protein n=1 Tax=Amborella trichopoda TaxID=13333 RepID=W1PKV2_AMBTC|nr:hypothetical protein AMTR_s00148p00067250 [Amborella trichopoda]
MVLALDVSLGSPWSPIYVGVISFNSPLVGALSSSTGLDGLSCLRYCFSLPCEECLLFIFHRYTCLANVSWFSSRLSNSRRDG